VTGTPTGVAFDPATKIFDLTFDIARPGGGRYPRRLETVVFVPERHYPNGYTVTAKGAKVTSKPCATLLKLQKRPKARAVTVQLTPGGRGARRCRSPSIPRLRS
jgi:endoglycosylceramidase